MIDFTVLKSELMWITPEMAREWLGEKNEGNRHLRGGYSDDLAGALRRGEWKLTHQGIAFARSGRLLDGQHRLRMIVATGQPLQTFVTTGLADDVFDAVDCGLKRSMSDRVRVDKNLASVCSLALRTVGLHTSPSCTKTLIAAGMGKCHTDLLSYAPTASRFFSSAPMRLAACITILDPPVGYDDDTIFDYVSAQYRALVLQHYDSMTPAAKALCRQTLSGRALAVKSSETLARGFRVFDPGRSQISKIQIRPDGLGADGKTVKGDVALAVARVREWVRAALKEEQV